MFLCDKVIPIIRVLALITESNTDAKKGIVDSLALKYCGNVFNYPKFCG